MCIRDRYYIYFFFFSKVFSEKVDKPLELAARDGSIFITGNKEISMNTGQQLKMSSDEDLQFVVKNSINVRFLFL